MKDTVTLAKERHAAEAAKMKREAMIICTVIIVLTVTIIALLYARM